MKPIPYPISLLLLLAPAILPGCGGPAVPEAPAAGQPIVLISIDTLRSDRLPAYGYDRVATPHLDALAADSLLFERAYTHCPLTLPSHATLLSGLLPPTHGVRDNRGFALGPEPPMLPEALQTSGYLTGGFVSSMVLRRGTGLARGFDRYDDEMPAPPSQARIFAERPGESTLEAIRGWLDEIDSRQPLFLFAHLYEPHAPYEAPEPYASRYADPYDAEIAWVDELVGRLLADLVERDLYDRALIVLLSDHGEGLGDHVELEHGLLLYREALQVPLMIKLPGGEGAGRRINHPVGLVDVAPTILALAGLDHEGLEGLPLLSTPGPPEGRGIYGETLSGHYQYGWAETRSVIRGDLHFIDTPRHELYDLTLDPGELDDLSGRRDIPPSMRDVLDEIGAGSTSTAEISQDELEALASLGYVGGIASSKDGPLPDPKDEIAEVVEFFELADRLGTGENLEIERRLVATMRRLEIHNEPVSRTVANNLMLAGEPVEAWPVLAPFGGSPSPDTRQLLGQIAAALGRGELARGHFEAVLAMRPDSSAAHAGLGFLALGNGRNVEARRRLLRAVELDPKSAEAWNGLAVSRAGEGDLAGAIDDWRRTVEIDPGAADAWFNLARAYQRLGREVERREAELRYEALTNLR